MFTTGNRGVSTSPLMMAASRSAGSASAYQAVAQTVPTTGVQVVVDRRGLKDLQRQAELAALAASPEIACRAAALLGSVNRDPYGGLIVNPPSQGMFDRNAASSLLEGISGVLSAATRSDFTSAAIAGASAGALRSAAATASAVAQVLGMIGPNTSPTEAQGLMRLASAIVNASSGVFSLAKDCIKLATDGLLFGGPEIADMIAGGLGKLITEAGQNLLGAGLDALMKSVELPAWAAGKLADIGMSITLPIAATAEAIGKALASMDIGKMGKAAADAALAAVSGIASAVESAISSVASSIASAAGAISGAISSLTNLTGGGLLALAKKFGSGLIIKRSEWNALLSAIRALLGIYPGRNKFGSSVGDGDAAALSLVGIVADILTALSGNGGRGQAGAFGSYSAVDTVLEAFGRGSRSNSTLLAAAQAALAAAEAAMGVGGRLPNIGLPDSSKVADQALLALAAACGMQSSLGSFLGSGNAWLQQLILEGNTTLPPELLQAIQDAIDASNCRAGDSNDWASQLTGWSNWAAGRGAAGSNAAGLATLPAGHRCPAEGVNLEMLGGVC